MMHTLHFRRGLLAAVFSWLAFASLVVATAPAVGAGPLADPTRPPGAQPASDTGNAARRHAAARPTGPASAPPSNSLQVQSLHLPRHGVPSALIDGRLVRVGDRVSGPFGERTVVAIDTQGVVLQGAQPGRGPQRLWLLSGVIKQPIDHPSLSTPPLTVAGRPKP